MDYQVDLPHIVLSPVVLTKTNRPRTAPKSIIIIILIRQCAALLTDWNRRLSRSLHKNRPCCYSYSGLAWNQPALQMMVVKITATSRPLQRSCRRFCLTTSRSSSFTPPTADKVSPKGLVPKARCKWR